VAGLSGPPHGILGRQGENAVSAATGLFKNTESFSVYGRTRIPDFIVSSNVATGLPHHVIEVKNVIYQPLTSQLRDYAALVSQDGARGIVQVALPSWARVSKNLQAAFDDFNNPLTRIPIP
jgi:hypothetical protein